MSSGDQEMDIPRSRARPRMRRIVLVGGVLAALAGDHAPVCVAQVQPRARLAPAHAQLVEALQASARVATALIQDEPGYQHMSNPAWQSDALTHQTVEWLDALA